jgi:hypothetical protein
MVSASDSVSSDGLDGYCGRHALGHALIVGLSTRVIAMLSGILLLSFALAMTFSLGVKAPLDFSVFSARPLPLLPESNGWSQ